MAKKDGDVFGLQAVKKKTEKTIIKYAKCGVDYISIGSLTHSINNFDLSLKAI